MSPWRNSAATVWPRVRPRTAFRLLPIAAPLGGGVIIGSRGEALTFTRSGTSACLTAADASSLVTVADGTPAVEPAGLLLQPSTTNLCIRTEAFDNAAWTKSNVTAPTADTVVAPDGNTTAEALTSTVNGGYVESTAAALPGTVGTISVWVKTAAGTQAGTLLLRDSTAGADVTSAAFTATTTWQRVSVATAAATAGNSHTIRLYPGGTGGTGTIHAWGAQMEANSVLSSYVAAGAAATTRSPDKLVYTAAVTLTTRPRFACVVTPQKVTAGANRYIMVARATNANDEWEWLIDTSGHIAIYCAVGGVLKGPATSTGIVIANQPNAVEGWYDGAKLWVKLNGAVDSAASVFTPATAMTAFSFGSYIDATAPLQGNIREVAIYA